MTHHVNRFHTSLLQIPDGPEIGHEGLRAVPLVTPAIGSVHLSEAVCELAATGVVHKHLHAFEEGFYVLHGTAQVLIADRWYKLSAGHYGVIPVGVTHAWLNMSPDAVTWLEVCSPQRVSDGRQDTFVLAGSLDAPDRVEAPDLTDPRTQSLGYWGTSVSQREEQAGTMDVALLYLGGGSYIKKLVDATLGATALQLIMGDLSHFDHGDDWERNVHDHAHEESFFILEGEMDAVVAGERYHLEPGDCVWVGVGTPHVVRTTVERCVFLEAQAPPPATRHLYRHFAPWERLGRTLEAERSRSV